MVRLTIGKILHKRISIILEFKFKAINQKYAILESENKSLKIANNLLGSNEGNQETKSKINSLIKEVDFCIQQVSEMN